MNSDFTINKTSTADPDLESRQAGATSFTKSGWLWLAAILLIELVSYHRLVVRDLEGLYPFSFDQGVYLTEAYDVFETFRNDGIVAGLQKAWFAPGHPTGVLLQAEAALVFLLLGASRTSALLVLFFHFALLQVCLFAALRKISGRDAPGFIAIALLLFSVSRYFYAGGLSDFRFDTPAACLYGITLAAFLASRNLSDRTWTIYFGIALAALVVTRFVSGSYVAIAIAVSVAIVLVLNRNRPADGMSTRQLLWRAVVVCGTSAAAALVFMFANLSLLFNYYFIGHFSGPEKSIRAAEQGVSDTLSSLLFYPRSLALDHLGVTFLGVAAILVLLAAGLGRVRTVGEEQTSFGVYPSQFFIVLIWIAVPLGLFTIDEAKSPVVAGVAVVPVALAVVWGYLLLTKSAGAGFKFRRYEAGVAAALVVLASFYNISQNARRRPGLEMARSAVELYAAYDDIASEIDKNRLTQPKVATDAILDYFNGPVVKVMTYERTGKFVDTRELLAGTIMAVPKATAMAALENADFALITLSFPAVERSQVYPFQKSMLEYRKEMQEYARSQMIPMRRVEIGGHRFQIYRRPRTELTGLSGDWLANTGSVLRLRVSDLQRFPHIILSGPTMHAEELKGGLVCQPMLISSDNLSGIPLPVMTRLGKGDYTIAIDATAALNASSDVVEISLDFPSYFVPAERGINADTRKLAISAPRSTRLVTGPSGYPADLPRSGKVAAAAIAR